MLEGTWVVALCALAIFLTWDHTRGDSVTIDEPLHLFAGAEYLSHGVLFTNPEHPPLAKDLAAWSLLGTMDLTPPAIVPGAPLPPLPELVTFLRANRVPYTEILSRARMPFRWLLALLIVVVYLAARVASGTPAAMLASALIALDPNFIAHAGVVHTDVAAALLMTLAVVLLIAAPGGSALRWLLAGLVLGLAIATKFTALVLVPLALLAPLFLLLEPGTSRRKLAESVAGSLIACILATFVVYAVYAMNMRDMHPDDAALASATFLRSRNADPATLTRYANLTRRAPEVGMFLSGMKGVQLASSNGRGWNYLHGKISRRGFPQYFFVAYLVKSTPALLLVTAAILAGGKRLQNRWSIGALTTVGVLFAVSIPSSFNIGVRHILPAVPLLAIVGASVLASRLSRRAFAIAATALIVSAAGSLASIHPFELGYFNFIGGPEWLSDSNVDWGQDLDRMHALLRERGWEHDTTVIVLSFPILHEVEQYRPFDGVVRPGRYATSAFMEHVGPSVTRDDEGPAAAEALQRMMDALRTRGRRIAQVGSSITIWELPSGDSWTDHVAPCHPERRASKKLPVFAGSKRTLIGGCLTPLIRPSATFSPQEPGGRRLSIFVLAMNRS